MVRIRRRKDGWELHIRTPPDSMGMPPDELCPPVELLLWQPPVELPQLRTGLSVAGATRRQAFSKLRRSLREEGWLGAVAVPREPMRLPLLEPALV